MRRHRTGASAPRSASGKIAALDGLRGIAILLVMLHHLGMALDAHGPHLATPLLLLASYASSGLILFFILSGFLLFQPYARAILGERPWPSARQFYLRRARRILPAYCVVLGVILLLLVLAGDRAALPSSFGALAPWFIIPLYDLRPDALRFIFGLDTPLWSLAVECEYYLLLPWLAVLLARLAGNGSRTSRCRRLAAALCGVAFLGLALRAGFTAAHYACPAATGQFAAPCGMQGAYSLLYGAKGKYWEVFAVGMLASVLYVVIVERTQLPRWPYPRLGWALAALALLGLCICGWWAWRSARLPYNWLYVPTSAGWHWQVFGEWAMGICFGALLLSALLVPGIARCLSVAPLRWAGVISYSLYLWHEPLLRLLFLPAGAVTPLRIVIVCLVILVFGAGSYLAVERPFLAYRSGSRR